jgi:hypothetical protein
MSTQMTQRSEKRLKKLREDCQKLKQEIGELGHVVPGTVQKRTYRCGKPSCRCAREGILHGPYYHWTRKVRGKTVNINLDREAAKLVREWIQNNRKLRRLCRQLEKKSLEVLKIVANLQDV